jgi:glycine cleavage system H protein
MSAANEVKDDRRYTRDHEWAKRDNDELIVGITAFAVDQLGDITLVNYDLQPGDTVQAAQSFGTIESVKTLSDLFAPVSGTILRVNEALDSTPELVNDDCWEQAWLVAIRPNQLDEEWSQLLDSETYRQHIAETES